jgi:hypothetical protein
VVNTKPLIVLSCLLLLLAPLSSWAAVSARIDKTIANQDDTLNLTLRIDQSGARAPDLSALEQDFYVVGTNQSSRHAYINGKTQSSTEWLINLIPQHTGRIVIPSFVIEGEATQPLTIQIKAAGASTDANLQPVFVESEINKSSVYVQEQFILTLRILYAVQIEQATLPDPVLLNASFKKIGENSFDKSIQGITYRVFERSYAVFPQQAGELTIPPVLFSAIQATDRQSVYRMQRSGTPIRKMTKEQKITVKPPPASFSGDTWLPAASLTLKETWSRDPAQLRVGESITRTITTSAQNLLDAQLPPVVFESVAGAKLYPDKGSLNATENAKGVYSTRIDSTAVIPTREGELVLPAVRVRWWDTQSSRSRVAVVPEKRLKIKPAIEDTVNQVTAQAFDQDKQNIAPAATTTEIITVSDPRWKITSAVFLILWLCSLFLYFRLRRKISRHAAASNKEAKPVTTLNEKKAFKYLSKEVARGSDKPAIRQAIIQWARCYWPDASIGSLQDIIAVSGHPSLSASLAQLDAALYGDEGNTGNWSGDSMIAVIKLIRQQAKSRKPQTPALQPLYKTPGSG